ncbi:MAG: cobalamin-dependent protein [Deltaproteobacteria bacterium]|nr:cobalamin-dependent protein [Deltaproteobacteria bacterium]
MKVALVSTYFDIEANGLRMLSAVLRRAGHPTKQIFLPKTGDGHTSEYPPAAVSDILELCKDVELVGLTLMSNNFLTASHLTAAIKRELGLPVVWGGIHPTVRPEESIEHADYVCVGEGEEAAVELADALSRGEDATGIQNIWAKRGDEVFRNPHRGLIEDLDSLPFADYSLEDHFVLEHGRVVRMAHEHLERFLLYRYTTSTSRGCILNCSFCCHNAFRKMYGAKAGNTRRRSVGHVIGELEQIKRHMPYVKRIVIDDDSFMDASVEYIGDFASQYKAREPALHGDGLHPDHRHRGEDRSAGERRALQRAHGNPERRTEHQAHLPAQHQGLRHRPRGQHLRQVPILDPGPELRPDPRQPLGNRRRPCRHPQAAPGAAAAVHHHLLFADVLSGHGSLRPREAGRPDPGRRPRHLPEGLPEGAPDLHERAHLPVRRLPDAEDDREHAASSSRRGDEARLPVLSFVVPGMAGLPGGPGAQVRLAGGLHARHALGATRYAGFPDPHRGRESGVSRHRSLAWRGPISTGRPGLVGGPSRRRLHSPRLPFIPAVSRTKWPAIRGRARAVRSRPEESRCESR